MKNPVKRVAAIALMAAMLFSCIPGASAYYSVVTYEDEEVTSRELAKIVAEEGMILLKNEPVNEGEKALPLAKGESIAVFGLSQIDYVYGGGGSGSFITEYAHSLWDGLLEKEEAGEIELYKGLRDKYVEYYNANNADTSGLLMMDSSQGQVLNDAGEMPLTDEDVAAAAARRIPRSSPLPACLRKDRTMRMRRGSSSSAMSRNRSLSRSRPQALRRSSSS